MLEAVVAGCVGWRQARGASAAQQYDFVGLRRLSPTYITAFENYLLDFTCVNKMAPMTKNDNTEAIPVRWLL